MAALRTRPPSPPLALLPTSPRAIFTELLDILISLDAKCQAVRGTMADLANEFRAAFPRTRLRLCPWRRMKDAPPYALYWVQLCRNYNPQLPLGTPGSLDRRYRKHLPTWRAYVSRLTKYVLFHSGGQLHSRRHAIQAFDNRRLALNGSLSQLSRARDRIRKMLLYGYPSRSQSSTSEPPPREIIPECLLHDRRLVALGAWRLARAIAEAESDLRALVSRHNANPPSPRLRLLFARDRDHPHGRVKWYDSFGRRSFSSLTKEKKRLISIPRHLHPTLTPFEQGRRRLSKVYLKHLGVLRRISNFASVPSPLPTADLHPPPHPAIFAAATTPPLEAS